MLHAGYNTLYMLPGMLPQKAASCPGGVFVIILNFPTVCSELDKLGNEEWSNRIETVCNRWYK